MSEVFDKGPDGGDVGGECFCDRTVGAGAGERDYGGWVGVLGGEDCGYGGEDGGTFPEAGDEDEGWFGHFGCLKQSGFGTGEVEIGVES